MTLNEYESHLDTIRQSISRQGERIVLKFSEPFSIALSDCSTDQALLEQVRYATLRLIDEPGMHLSYAAVSLIQTARGYELPLMKAKALYAPHEITFIDDAVRSPGAPVRFENGSGELAGNNALVMERPLDPRTSRPAATVRLTRPTVGDKRFTRIAEVSAIEVVSTRNHIVFSFDGNMQWRFPYWASRDKPVGESARFALRHQMHAADCDRAIGDVKALFEGLAFTHTVRHP